MSYSFLKMSVSMSLVCLEEELLGDPFTPWMTGHLL